MWEEEKNKIEKDKKNYEKVIKQRWKKILKVYKIWKDVQKEEDKKDKIEKIRNEGKKLKDMKQNNIKKTEWKVWRKIKRKMWKYKTNKNITGKKEEKKKS